MLCIGWYTKSWIDYFESRPKGKSNASRINSSFPVLETRHYKTCYFGEAKKIRNGLNKNITSSRISRRWANGILLSVMTLILRRTVACSPYFVVESRSHSHSPSNKDNSSSFMVALSVN